MCFAGLLAAPVIAAPIDLADLNSAVSLDPNAGGAVNWTVDGVQNFGQLWYWLRFDNDPEQSIDNLNLTIPPGHPLDDSSFDNGDIRPDTLTLVYDGSHTGIPYSVEIVLSLSGGDPGSGESLLNQSITISNNASPGGGQLDMRFYEYVNFSLADTPANDSVHLSSDTVGQPVNTARQWDISQSQAEGIVTVRPSAVEADLASTLLTKLNDAAPTVFSNNDTAGPGDVAWVFEWHKALDPQNSLVFSETKRLTIIPAPAAAGLGLIGGLALVARRRRRN
ncbi:MAG: hypothetical protein CMJ49_11625 [Planctomycetaceae bacterium]|nr:hypothetical protein [Planctomycetaceae bacterium]